MSVNIEIFISYAPEDERLKKKLEKHLALLQRREFILTWHDRDISAGREWATEIDAHLNSAQIILLLVSAAFLASEYCYSREMMRALKKHDDGQARVIPIILRTVDWEGAPFRKLQALPTGGRPVTGRGWRNVDEALADVAQGIRKTVQELSLLNSEKSQPSQATLLPRYEHQQLASDVIFVDTPSTTQSAGLGEDSLQKDVSFHKKFANYLQQQKKRLFDALASGSTYLRVGDIIGEHGLFVPPPWNGTFEAALESDLTKQLMKCICQRQPILLLGEAGQGKTTLLKQVFALLVDLFLSGSDENTPLPVYIPLREIPSFTGNALNLLWEQLGDEFPLDYDDFMALVRTRRLVFLFDGFDEIQGEITPQLVNTRAASKIFHYPSLLSCRKSFFDFYLARSPLQEIYARRVELLSFTLSDPVRKYIIAFCQQKQQQSNQPWTLSPEAIFQKDHSDLGKMFQQEKEHLKAILEGAME